MKVFNNESFDKGAITPCRQISILTLIYKKGDKFKLQNYRPICLTNCDYRILASTLANRLHQILHIMISTDQSGYVLFFIEKNKQERINRKTIICNIEQGGLSMIDVESFHTALKQE